MLTRQALCVDSVARKTGLCNKCVRVYRKALGLGFRHREPAIPSDLEYVGKKKSLGLGSVIAV